MRTNLLYQLSAAWAMAVALASCSADEPVARNTSDNAIKFSVVADNQTRASHSYNNNNVPDDFYVWAKRTTTAEDKTTNEDSGWYIDGGRIHNNGTSNDPVYADADGIHYWPEDGTLSFYAFVDLQKDNNNQIVKPVYDEDNKRFVVENYEINQNPADQLDLMYAVKKDATQGDDGEVQLNFHHALSQICFKAQNDNPNSIITIHSIAVKNVYMKGDFTLPNTDTNIDGNADPTSDDSNPWNIDNGSIGDINTIILDTDIDGSNGNAVNLTYGSTEKALNLLPQERNSDKSPYKVAFEIVLTVKSKDSAGNLIVTKYNNHKVYVEVDDFPTDNTQDVDWKPGVRYIYTLHFPNNWDPANRKIQYSVQFADFTEQEQYGKDLTMINNHQAVLMREANTAEKIDPLYVATSNIGANGDPTEAGLFFWWGDTKGQETGKDNFVFNEFNKSIITNKKKSELNDYLDENNNLKLDYDAAHKIWGEPWRIPTNEDLQWLIDNCTWYLVKDGNTIGYRVVSKTTGGVIFLPAAGCYERENSSNKPYVTGDLCFCWSSTIGDDNGIDGKALVYRLKVSQTSHKDLSDGSQIDIKTTDKLEGVKAVAPIWNGFPIRAVANSAE